MKRVLSGSHAWYYFSFLFSTGERGSKTEKKAGKKRKFVREKEHHEKGIRIEGKGKRRKPGKEKIKDKKET